MQVFEEDPWTLLDEDAKKQPKGIVGRFQLQAEKLVEEAMHYAATSRDMKPNARPLNGMILRFSNIYGATDISAHPSGFIAQLVHNAIRGLPLQIAGRDRVLDFVHVSDAVRSVVLAIAALESPTDNRENSCDGRVFNVGRGKAVRMDNLVHAILRLTNSISGILVLPPPRYELSTLHVNIGRTREVLGYVPKVPLTARPPAFLALNASPQVSMVEGLRAYVAGIQVRTLKYLADRIDIFCNPMNATFTSPLQRRYRP